MIKILSTGTFATIIHGIKAPRKHTVRGLLGDGSKECHFETEDADLLASWNDDCLDTQLKVNSEMWIKKITLEFKFRSPKKTENTAVWTESYSSTTESYKQKNPTAVVTQGKPRRGAWAMWLSESMDSNGLFLSQLPPIVYPVRFQCSPRRGSLIISWDIVRRFTAGESMQLPSISIGRGQLDTMLPLWRNKWKATLTRNLPSDRRIGWYAANLVSLGELNETLSALKNAKIGVEWFAIGPEFVSLVGDWTTPNDAFRDRMGSACLSIRENSFIPGIRFAPFLVSKKSSIANEHRDWLVGGVKGSPAMVNSYGPDRGRCFVLDITIPEVKNHIRRMLKIMRDQWGFRAFLLERIGDAALPGRRFNDTTGPGELIQSAGQLIREVVGPKMLVTAADIPLLTASDSFDGQFISFSPMLVNNDPVRRRHPSYMNLVSTLLHRAPWTEIAWVNAAGPLPIELFQADSGPAEQSLVHAAVQSCGLLVLTGDPRKVNGILWDNVRRVVELFSDCRQGTLTPTAAPCGGRKKPLIVRNNRGWIALFNLSGRKHCILLEKEGLKNAFGIKSTLSAWDGTVFNSPEIHVTLPPRSHRLFRG